MIGGTIIDNTLMMQSETNRPVRRLWCYSEGEGECAVYADPDEAEGVRVGDSIWWQSGKIMWTRRPYFHDRTINKIGYSFDPTDNES